MQDERSLVSEAFVHRAYELSHGMPAFIIKLVQLVADGAAGGLLAAADAAKRDLKFQVRSYRHSLT